ncbi:unnamed protein product [Prunus brigantina]
MWIDIGSPWKYDAVGVLGLLPEQKLTAALWMLAYEASAEQVDEIARMRKSTILDYLVRFCDTVENLYTREYLRKPMPKDLQRLLQKAEARGFPRNDWKHRLHALTLEELSNCLARRLWESKGQKSIILEAVTSFNCWICHAFFGVAESQNDLNVLGQSRSLVPFKKVTGKMWKGVSVFCKLVGVLLGLLLGCLMMRCCGAL